MADIVSKGKHNQKDRRILLRRLCQLFLEDLEIYMDDLVTEELLKAYNWPKKFLGLTMHVAMLDATRVMLLAVLHHHCPPVKA